jgi:DNA invertase Pin-like site-specific DNA recombinase
MEWTFKPSPWRGPVNHRSNSLPEHARTGFGHGMTNDSPDAAEPLGGRLAGVSGSLAEGCLVTDRYVDIYWKKIDKRRISVSFLTMKTLVYSRQSSIRNEPEAHLLRAAVESRGDTVIATFTDDPTILGKGKYTGWRALIVSLDQTDQVFVSSVGDLPGRTVADLLKILSVLNEHGVGLFLSREAINTDDGAAAILALTTAYRAAKRSEAIRVGQAKARMAGKRLGRPRISNRIGRQIQTDLASGAGIRPTARKYNISPASVINIRRMTDAEVIG